MSSVQAEASSHIGPNSDEIFRQTERVLQSAEFQAPERGRRFLRFVVDETLAGRSQFLKAFTIANEIFGRETSFDAQNDPVVRIEASRIRRALERYYLVAGQNDEIVITIPKGGYVPHFEYAHVPPRPAPAEQAAEHHPHPTVPTPRWTPALAFGFALLVVAASLCLFLVREYMTARPSSSSGTSIAERAGALVVVDAFDTGGSKDGADIVQGLRDEVIGQLAKFDEVVVVSDPAKAVAHDTTGYALQANVQFDGDRLRWVARLVRRADATVIWANTYDADRSTKAKLEIQAEIAQQIAVAVAQPYGAIFQTNTETIARTTRDDEGGVYACTLAYYSYRRSMDAGSHRIARDCLLEATQRFPNSATAWALLALTYLDESRFRYKLGPATSAAPLDSAARAAERALSIAPGNARALQASMLVNFFNGDVDKALQEGAAAFAANTDDTEVAGEYGLRLAMSGRWDSGCELVSNALGKNAGPKGYFEVGMALCAQMRGDNQAAELWSRMSDLTYSPLHHLVLVSILGAEGKTAEASRERDWLNANAPDLMANLRPEIVKRLRQPADQERFFNGLRAAGIAIDDRPQAQKQ